MHDSAAVAHSQALVDMRLTRVLCTAALHLQPALFKQGGLNFNMQQTAARTREGLAKISLPFKLPGGGSSDGQH